MLLSLRYKNLQRGISDHELLELLREKCGDDAVTEALQTVLHTTDICDFWREDGRLPSERLFSLNWKDYDDAKANILHMLQA